MSKINIITVKSLDTNEYLFPPGIFPVNLQPVAHNKYSHSVQGPHSFPVTHPTSSPCTDTHHLHTMQKNETLLTTASKIFPNFICFYIFIYIHSLFIYSFTFCLSQKKYFSHIYLNLISLPVPFFHFLMNVY